MDDSSSGSSSVLDEAPVQMRRSKRGQPLPEDLPITDDPDNPHAENGSKPGHKDSLRDRMQFLFTRDESRLVQAVRDRIAWGHVPFAPDPRSYRDLAPEKGTDLTSFTELRLIGAALPPSGAAIMFEDATLHPGLTRQATRVLLLNMGSPVSRISWAPYREGNDQFLAVGVVHDAKTGPLDRDAAAPELSVFSDTADLESFFYIYSFNPDSEVLELHSSITSKFGPVISLSWQPVADSRTLAVVFQRGQLVVLNINERGSFEISGPVLNLDTKITCCAWRSPSAIVVGTLAGEIAEFDLSDGLSPSFVYALSTSPMTAVSTTYPEYSNFVFVSSMDGNSRIVDLRDIKHVRATASQRARTYYTESAWSPFLDSFVSFDDMLTSRLVPLWHSEANLVGFNLTRHLSSITALAASPVHPMILSGGLDGSCHIVNGVRRAMVVRRVAKPPNEAVIWTLECSEANSTYRFTENLVSQPLGKPPGASDKLSLFPKTCTITSIDWIASKAHGGWYAAATAGGLIRIENLAQ